jgi:hypothetical protein
VASLGRQRVDISLRGRGGQLVDGHIAKFNSEPIRAPSELHPARFDVTTQRSRGRRINVFGLGRRRW